MSVVARAEHQLSPPDRDLLIERAKTGVLRDDVAPDELARYGLHALTAASSLSQKPRSAGSSKSPWTGCALCAEVRDNCQGRARLRLDSLNVRVLNKPVDIASLAQVLAEHSSVGA